MTDERSPPFPPRPLDRASALAAMPRAFPVFLGRFARLTAIQAEGMPVLLAGADAVLVAPAASGKTEAVLAPLCERLRAARTAGGRVPPSPVAADARRPAPSAGLLYLVPTRALANDVELRIAEPAAAMGLDAAVRTGDRPASFRDRAPDLLVTTPESFDSLLCRHPALFAGLSAAVVDEAHLLDGTARGDQLRVLFRRLLALEGARRPQFAAMTATVGDPAALGARLFGAPPVVVAAGAARPIRMHLVDDLAGAFARLRRDGLSKVIAFCNSRRAVEALAAGVARAGVWPRERVAVHHASLPRREREDVEKAFRWWEAGLIVCTTTMELGVDIGDVDAVLLSGAPGSLASFRQRVGRGCRRRAGMVAVCVPETPGDREAFEAIRRQVEAGETPVEPYLPDLSVAVQQAFSILFAHPRGLARDRLLDLLAPLGTPRELAAVVDHLVSEGHLAAGPGGRVLATTEVMDLGEKGRIHGNIADGRAVKVFDAATGRQLGEVATAAAGGSLALGGRTWTVVGRGRDGLRVVPGGPAGDGAAFATRRDAGAFARYLPTELRR